MSKSSSVSLGRIIPAYAGSTNGLVVFSLDPQDHPRIRGEHRQEGRSQGLVWGSSPHTRGALEVGDPQGRPSWIIPAYAGSTVGVRLVPARQPDHPRIRGEHTWKSLQYQGSPP